MKSVSMPVSSIARPSKIKAKNEWRIVRNVGQSLSSGELPYDAAVLLASISRKIYLPGDKVSCPDPVAFEIFGLESLLESLRLLCIEKNRDLRFFEQGRSRAVGFTMEDYAFVVFRGTDPCSLADWWTDAQCWCTGRPRRHAGFYGAWRRIAHDIRQWLAELPYASHGVILSGHSLGGAMALLAAYDLSEEFLVAAVITFGAPRVGGLGFHRAYNEKRTGPLADARQLSEVTWRFVNLGDLISVLPPALLYYHVGHAIGVSRAGLTWTGLNATNQPLDAKAASEFNPLILPGAIAMRASPWLQRLEYALSDVPPGPGVPASADWLSVLKAFAYPASYIVGVLSGPAWWIIVHLVRATIFSFADHPSQFYVEALPLRRERADTFSIESS